jgi:CHAD domain-containing protein
MPSDGATAAPIMAALQAQLEALQAREPGVRIGRDPEELRRMRIAARRLRATLRAGREVLGPRMVDGLRSELDWLGTALGEVRDVDLVTGYVATEVGALSQPVRKPGARLLRRLEIDRAHAWDRLLAALDGPRYPRLMGRLKTVLGRSPRRPLAESLPESAAAQWKRVRRAVKRLPSRPSAAEMHEVRVKLKRARYAAELAAGAVGRPAERFVEQAKRVQDILGEHQDAVVIEEYLHDVIDGREGAHALEQQLIGRQRKRRKKMRAAFDRRWPKLERRGRKAWSGAA